MAFPYTYRKKKALYLKEKYYGVNTNYIQSLFYSYIQKRSSIEEIDSKKSSLTFISSAPVLKFHYSTEIVFNKEREEINIIYEVNLEKLLTIVLISIILSAFFTFVSVKYFLILAGLLTILFYGVFYLIIDNYIDNLILKSLKRIVVSSDIAENYSDEQMKWINDDSLCSACGNKLSEFDFNCKECGIKLKRNKYTIPLDLSKYKDREVSYHFKKKQ